VSALGDSVGVPLIVFTRHDENVVAINNMLRQAGHPVHCARIDQLKQLESALRGGRIEMLLMFADEKTFEISEIAALLSKIKPCPPLLVVANRVDEQRIADAMECGAHDVVSLTHKNRFQAVVDRELHAFRLKVALGGVVTSAKQYRKELKTMMEGTAEAIADVQEGILVAVNPPWLEMFGYDSDDDLLNLPFMDHCDAADHEMLKGALVACLKHKWDGAPLNVRLRHASDGELLIEINLERVTVEGDAAVRITVPVDKSLDGSPTELLEQTVFKDPATGFYHRHYFVDKLQQRLDEKLTGGVRALAYIRPDKFGRIHDEIGLLATETLLTGLAATLKELMLPRDLYGRFGGTMFVVMLERGTMNDVESWAEHIRKTVGDAVFEIEQQSTSLTCTVGLCELLPGEASPAAMLTAAELACRAGRKAGGNTIRLSDNTNATQTIRALDAAWVPRLRTALMENRLQLVHQPISGLAEDVQGMIDTRVQMLDEQDDLIPATEFIPAAERAGMIKNIDRWVFVAAFAYCAKEQPTVAFVRLSGESLNDESLIDWLKTQLQNRAIKSSQVCFQVSEDDAARYLKQAKDVASKLRGLGFRFAIDHVGVGRNPEQLLENVPMDYMKIDGSLMQGLNRSPDKQNQVSILVKIAKNHAITTIAERVEDANTMAILWQLGIAYIQGNYAQMPGVVLEDEQTISGAY
jgi:diguanylate cyclase (GGDEF)-like protein